MCCVVRPTAAFELGLNRATWLILFGIYRVSVFGERLRGLDIGQTLSRFDVEAEVIKVSIHANLH